MKYGEVEMIHQTDGLTTSETNSDGLDIPKQKLTSRLDHDLFESQIK
jgi:hypothetical protein